LIAILFHYIASPSTPQDRYTYTHLLNDLNLGRVHDVRIIPDRDISNVGVAEVHITGVGRRTVNIPDISMFMDILQQARYYNPSMSVDVSAPPRPSLLMQMLPMLIMGALFIVVIVVIMSQAQGGGGGRAANFGKSRARMTLQDSRKVTFDQVAGLDEEKEELAEVVGFLKNSQKYRDIGARVPRGILLVGPPGTGKTYLARAVAGEANVPFFSISGSDFVELYVGVGASRVRDLFEQAKRNAPSIIVIDEIDAVGRRRGAGMGGGHDEREQTLNQLLVEMDGFGLNEGVIVLAATNRPDILDPALLRPGRFDRRVAFSTPDVKGREAVLNVHAVGKKFADDVSMAVVAQTTVGFSPADLENLLNEGALLAAREDKTAIDMESLRKAFIKVGVGTEKKSRVITEKERRITAYHEAGHAVCHELLPDVTSTYMISIIPTGRAAGYVMPLPRGDNTHLSKKNMEQEIITLMGGRAAEAVILNDITTGASNDIEQATNMARNMVVRYGMSETLGPIQFGNDNNEVFLGRDFANQRNYSEQVASIIDNEVKSIVENAYNEAIRLVETHLEVMQKIVKLLMEKERVPGEEVRALFPYGTLPKKDLNNIGFLNEDSL
jgi:cell division protease FtsH